MKDQERLIIDDFIPIAPLWSFSTKAFETGIRIFSKKNA
jgi:hypothetical protein